MKKSLLERQADLLVTDPHDIDDQALDFVEQEVGRIDFLGNWPNFFQRERRVADWLARNGYPRENTPHVIARIQELHRRGHTWPYR